MVRVVLKGLEGKYPQSFKLLEFKASVQLLKDEGICVTISHKGLSRKLKKMFDKELMKDE